MYQVELKFVAWVTELIGELREANSVLARELCDHLDRASLSALFNTAEGNGKRQRRTRAKFFDTARGSATECAACLDAAVARGLCSRTRVADGKAMLVRVVSMLCRLVDRYTDAGSVHEDVVPYELDDEDDDEHDCSARRNDSPNRAVGGADPINERAAS